MKFYIKNIALVFIAAFIGSCSSSNEKIWEGTCINEHDIGTIEIIDALDKNALRIILTVETAKDLDSYIRYWEYTGSDSLPADSLFLYSPLCKNKKAHELMLVNLKPDTRYNFNVVIQDQKCKTYSKTYDFTTKRQPPWIPYYPENNNLTDVSFNSYIHFHRKNKPGYLYIIDDSGTLVWYKTLPFTIKVSKFTKASTFLNILADDTLKFSRGNKLAEVDLFGQLLYKYDADEKGSNLLFHHEIDLDENGNINTLIYSKRVFDLSEVGGSEADTVQGDGILIMDKNDSILWEWSVFDVMHPKDYANILNEKDDWLHANAFCKDTDGHFIISFRNSSEIWKVSRDTGEIIWKLGGDNDQFNLPDSLKFNGQHNVQITENGLLRILDNGNLLVKPGLVDELHDNKAYFDFMKDKLKGFQSRQLVFDIDDKNKKAVLVENIVFPKEFMSKSQGSSSAINDSLIMFCSTNTNSIIFTNSKGELRGKVALTFDSYRAQYIPELYPTEYVK